MVTTSVVDYEKKKNTLLSHLQQRANQKGAIRLQKKTSNLFRHRKKTQAKWLDLTAFNQVINIDPINLIAEVEGLVTFEELVAQTLKYHCLPQVVPELKSITVGGAIAGLAAESSSFKFGLVHETVTEMEVLLSHGQVVSCSPNNEHHDLFYAIPGSYGTLGYVLKAKIRLIPAKPYVQISRLRFSNAHDYFVKMAELVEAQHDDIDFIDGTGLGNEIFITLGRLVDQAPYVSDYKFMNIYYQSIARKSEDFLTTSDYIWRWDMDWFWCSKYFLMQNVFFRFLLGKWMLKSTVYWKIMHVVNSNDWIRNLTNLISPKTETIIQDLQIPLAKADEFYQFFKQNLHIDPMWICPIKLNPAMNKFLFCQLEKNQLYINFGAYGNFLPSDKEIGYFNRLIENRATACGGNKCLYSNVFYSEQEFWQLYDKKAYFSVKEKYDPNSLLSDIYAKCSEKIV